MINKFLSFVLELIKGFLFEIFVAVSCLCGLVLWFAVSPWATGLFAIVILTGLHFFDLRDKKDKPKQGDNSDQ